MKKFALILLLLASPFILLCNNPRDDKKKNPETKVADTPGLPEGIVYSLPRTGLLFEVSVMHTQYFPGPYVLFAGKYLGAGPVEQAKKDTWEITSIRVILESEPDPSSVFFCTIPAALSLSLKPGMILNGIQVRSENQQPAITGFDHLNPKKLPAILFPDQSAEENYYIEVNPETGDEIVKIKSLEEKAREAADFLSRIRQKRAFKILSASDIVPEDGLGYQVFVEQAAQLEKEYVSLFMGKTFKNEEFHSFLFYPDSSDTQGKLLFRFAEDKGVLPVSDISGRPVVVQMSIDQPINTIFNDTNIVENPAAGERGLFYRIPAYSSFRMMDGISTLYSGSASIGQLGAIARVPAELLKGGYQISFDPFTGAVLDIVKTDFQP